MYDRPGVASPTAGEPATSVPESLTCRLKLAGTAVPPLTTLTTLRVPGLGGGGGGGTIVQFGPMIELLLRVLPQFGLKLYHQDLRQRQM